MVKIFLLIRKVINEHNWTKPILYPIYRLVGLLYSSQIPLTSELGNNLKFMHWLYGIFIAGGARVGDNVTFYHHVTLGGK